MLKKFHILALMIMFVLITPAVAQKGKIKRQKKVVNELRQSIKNEENKIKELKKNKASAQELVTSLANQIENRTALIQETTSQIKELTEEVREAEKRIKLLGGQLIKLENSVGRITRSAYRNYRYQNNLTYIFSSKSFAEIARRISMLRLATDYRQGQIKEVISVRTDVQEERAKLAKQREELAEVKKQYDIERKKLNEDMDAAKKSIEKMTKQEKEALVAKQKLESRLSQEVNKLKALTKNNKVGSSFVSGSKLNLPVAGGKIIVNKGHAVEISGPEGASVTSVYEGKVLKIARNKVNNKYDVYIAHGQYITTYSNLADVSVSEGKTVKKNQRIGTIGAAFDFNKGVMVNKIIFMITSPNPGEKVSAMAHFKK